MTMTFTEYKRFWEKLMLARLLYNFLSFRVVQKKKMDK